MQRKIACACVLFLLACGLTGATVLVHKDFADLVDEADRIVVGRVLSTAGQWDASGRFIRTDVSMAVEENLIGGGPAEFVLRTPGGRIGDEGQLAHGAATFVEGTQVLVFLTTWEDGTPKVLGYAQGKADVFYDVDGRARLRGGRVDGRTLESVRNEVIHGPEHNIPLRPVQGGR